MASANKTPRELEATLADDYLDAAILAREVSREALQRALEQAKAGELRDPAKAAVNAATASGILLDKRLVLQERPTQITEHRDPTVDGKALLRELGLGSIIESTATEIPTPTLPAAPTSTSPAPESARKTRPRARKPAASKAASQPED